MRYEIRKENGVWIVFDRYEKHQLASWPTLHMAETWLHQYVARRHAANQAAKKFIQRVEAQDAHCPPE